MSAIAEVSLTYGIAMDGGDLKPRSRHPASPLPVRPSDLGATRWGRLPPEVSLRQFAVLMFATWGAFLVAWPYLLPQI